MQIWCFSMQAVVTSPLYKLQSFLEVQCKVGQNFPCPTTPFLFLWKCSNINEEDKNMVCICLREHERNKCLSIYLLCHASSYSINGKSFHTSCLPPNPLSHGICLENGKLASTLLSVSVLCGVAGYIIPEWDMLALVQFPINIQIDFLWVNLPTVNHFLVPSGANKL